MGIRTYRQMGSADPPGKMDEKTVKTTEHQHHPLVSQDCSRSVCNIDFSLAVIAYCLIKHSYSYSIVLLQEVLSKTIMYLRIYVALLCGSTVILEL